MLLTLSFAVGVVVGWFTTKPVWFDNVINKVVDKVTSLIKK